MHSRTIIIGGGMAGMSCAVSLLGAGQDFLLITENLGGRIMYSESTGVNHGAYFIMGNYTNAKKLLIREDLLNPLTVCFHNSETERFGVLSLHTLRLASEVIRFFIAMREFASHYDDYKKRCLSMPQKAALAADPYMEAIFSKPASRFATEKGYAQFSQDYVSKFTYACTGANTDSLTALDFLNVSMGLMVPIHRFKFDRKAMITKLGSHLVHDSIIAIESQDGQHFLSGNSGTIYQAQNIVLATPAAVTQGLLKIGEIRGACKIYAYHVKAELKPLYREHEINLFPFTSPLMLTAKQFDGTYLVYGREQDIDLHQVCENFEVLSMVPWEKAMYVFGKAYLEQQYGENIFVAGDHNGLGLEPAAISGLYAANQIIQKSAA